ncbi:MAG: alpha-glucosidase/alpha-galactosidase [Planctomycetes bacterium]|nr:alpha-glucosidase/alpha-galactosidase [Planctomycetota bacterium]
MASSLNIGVIGAGSAVFSLGLVRDLCLTDGLHGSRVVLMDTDQERLDRVHLLATRYVEELDVPFEFEKTLDRDQALDGADVVINTALVGGHDHMEAQRDLAEKHGYYRGFTLSTFLQLGLMLEIVRDMERLCPDAWLIESANPVFEGCTLMTRQSDIKVLGLCHGHYGYRRIARELGLDVEKVTFEAPGFNHCIWMTKFEHEGRDAYPLIDEWIETKAEEFWRTHKPGYGDNQMSRAAMHQYRLFGLMPIGDTPRIGGWWYHVDLDTKKHWYGHLGGFDSEIGWAQYLKNLDERVAKIECAAHDTDSRVTEAFPPQKSGEQIVPIIDGLFNDNEGHFQVNIPNNGVLDGVPDDVVVEVPGVVNKSGIKGYVTQQLPRNLMLQVMQPRLWRAECTLDAFLTGDRRLLLTLLLDDHRTRSLDQAKGFLAAALSMPGNERLLELFAR